MHLIRLPGLLVILALSFGTQHTGISQAELSYGEAPALGIVYVLSMY